MNKRQDTEVLIVGAGPAGLVAGITAASSGRKVLLLEKNSRLGWKLSITGKGRCNITNNVDVNTLMQNIPGNGKFLYSVFSQFDATCTMDFFENIGLRLKTERGNRVFPRSDNAKEVVELLERAAREVGVVIIKNCVVSELIFDGSRCVGVRSAGSALTYFAESVLITCGGLSYPKTGSTGDGYTLAKSAGHSIVVPRPSLVPLETVECCADLMGVSLKNVTLSLMDKHSGRELFREIGEMLFTHFGVTGPLVLSASAHIRPKSGKVQLAEDYSLAIDFKPALSLEQLDLRLQRDFKESPNKEFGSAMRKLLPGKMAEGFANRTGIDISKQLNSVTKTERLHVVGLLKKFELSVKSFRPIDEAIITSGGVCVKEVSPKTLQSKLSEGLYFAGEVLDVDGYTGGFNLQIAFSTGVVAGRNL